MSALDPPLPLLVRWGTLRRLEIGLPRCSIYAEAEATDPRCDPPLWQLVVVLVPMIATCLLSLAAVYKGWSLPPFTRGSGQ